MIWELSGYDTELRGDRFREYTASELRSLAWERLERIEFSDSGHGIVFIREEHSGRRKPEKPLSRDKETELREHREDLIRERRARR